MKQIPELSRDQPHHRWRLRKEMELLAVCHDSALAAIRAYDGALSRAAQAGPCSRASRARLSWFASTALLTCALLAWTSTDTLHAMTDDVPPGVALLPGVLLGCCLTGTAWLAAPVVRERLAAGSDWSTLSFLGAAALAAAAWLVLWLRTAVEVTSVLADASAVSLTLAIVAALLVAVPPRGAETDAPAQGRTHPPWRVRRAREKAEAKVRGHTRSWNAVAHTFGAAAVGTPAEEALTRLITGRSDALSSDIVDSLSVLLLAGLRQYHPAPLMERLTVLSGELPEQRTAAQTGEERLDG